MDFILTLYMLCFFYSEQVIKHPVTTVEIAICAQISNSFLSDLLLEDSEIKMNHGAWSIQRQSKLNFKIGNSMVLRR